ncbi:hypothetical protein SOCE26_027010 [Sorangium cellulosum]|uniref:Copper type II ascorbate-dependent monooxygenase C-terminal domain-containing protein n=1 Tax=Sorangium cellulosum TaxID=56 RepID=A0A2L0EPQ6_SORCE|nr:hypothetical protein [Sorangium cellulosum]AUX41291.1 hypothetical protein SOCE26_027010 [Sorangium cellulosum]
MRTSIVLIALLGAQALAGCSSGGTGDPSPDSDLLEPPPPGAGVQYRMVSTVAPGQEIERCKLFVAPPEGLYVQRDEVRFSSGSHHVILYKTAYREIPAETREGIAVDATEVHDCNRGATAAWEITGVIAGSQSYEGESFLGELPDGVALRVEPGTVLVMNTHYLNATPEPLEADARVNLHTILPEQVEQEAGMLFHYNPFIRVPAQGEASSRMRCPIAEDISLVRVQSHMHRRGVGFAAHHVRAGGGMDEIYTNEAWEQVPVKVFDTPLEVKAGEALDFRCDYVNTEPRDVAQGLTTRDEMCMLIGPYFPRRPGVDTCSYERGVPAETWFGSGAATCAEALACTAAAASNADVYGCVVDSCPGAAEQLTGVLRCQITAGYGACEDACTEGAGPLDACDVCMADACAAESAACAAAACD